MPAFLAAALHGLRKALAPQGRPRPFTRMTGDVRGKRQAPPAKCPSRGCYKARNLIVPLRFGLPEAYPGPIVSRPWQGEYVGLALARLQGEHERMLQRHAGNRHEGRDLIRLPNLLGPVGVVQAVNVMAADMTSGRGPGPMR